MTNDTSQDQSSETLTLELHSLLHGNFPSRPDICILTAKQLLSCPAEYNFQFFLEKPSFIDLNDKRHFGREIIEKILTCRLPLLRYQFSLVLLQLTVHLIQKQDQEEGERRQVIDSEDEEAIQAHEKKKSANAYYKQLTNMVIGPYLELVLHDKAGPKELNLILGVLCNLSRDENGQKRLLEQKEEDDLDDDELDELDENLTDDDEEDDYGITKSKTCGRFVPWVCKKMLSYTEEELEKENEDTATDQKIDDIDTYTRCIQLLLNITRTEDGRNFILKKEQEPVLKRVIYTVSNGPTLRRRGSVGIIRNCLLLREQHSIVGAFEFIEKFLSRIENKNEPDDATRRDIAEVIYILTLGSQVVKIAPHKARIMQLHDDILHNIAEKRLLKKAHDEADGRTEKVQEGDYIRFDEESGVFHKVDA